MTRRKTNFDSKEIYQRGHFYLKEYDDDGNITIRDLSAMPEKEAVNFLNAAIMAAKEAC